MFLMVLPNKSASSAAGRNAASPAHRSSPEVVTAWVSRCCGREPLTAAIQPGLCLGSQAKPCIQLNLLIILQSGLITPPARCRRATASTGCSDRLTGDSLCGVLPTAFPASSLLCWCLTMLLHITVKTSSLCSVEGTFLICGSHATSRPSTSCSPGPTVPML